jgi:outer membrane protein
MTMSMIRTLFAFTIASLSLALPAAAAEQPLTLDQALAAADERNLTLEAIRFELDRSDAQLSQTIGLVLPVASAGMTWNHADHEDTMDLTSSLVDMMSEAFEGMPVEIEMEEGEPSVIRRQDDLSGTVTVAMAVINAENWSTIRVAKRGAELAEASVEDARQELLLGTAQAWYAARMTGELVGLAEAQVAAAEHHREVALARIEAGSGLRIDQVRAEADLASAQQDLLDATLAWENTRDALGVLTGMGGLPTPTGDPLLAAPLGSDDDLVAAAMPHRTDLATSRATLDMSRAQLGTTWAGFAPTVDLAWQGSYQFTEPTDMGSDDRSRWSLVASLNVPLYDHFRYGELHERRAALRQAQAQLADAEAQAALGVREARRDHETATAAVQLARQQAALADEALQLTLDAYEVGAGSSLEVTDARRSASTAQVNLATTSLQADLALLGLLRESGRDMLGVAGR